MAYQKPQAIIHQQFETIPNITEDELRAVIVGPSAILHRYADSDEKIDTFLGLYNPEDDVTYLYPGRSAGGIVDKSYSKLYVDNALLSYFLSTEHKQVEDDKAIKRATTTFKNSDNTLESVNLFVDGNTEDATHFGSDATGAYKPGTDTCVRVYTYARYSDDPGSAVKYYKKYDSTSTETDKWTYTSDALVASTETDGTRYTAPSGYTATNLSFVHKYTPYTTTIDGSSLTVDWYVNAAGTGMTSSTSEAMKVKDASVPLYIVASDEPDYKYGFFSPYDSENDILSDTDNYTPFNFKATSKVARNGELGVRDVQIGDYALLWTTYKNTAGLCVEEGPQLSRIIGFREEETTASVGDIQIVQPTALTEEVRDFDLYLGSIKHAGSWDSSTTKTTATTTRGTYHQGDSPISPFNSGLVYASSTNTVLGIIITMEVAEVVTSGNCKDTIYATISYSDESISSKTVQLLAGESNKITLLEDYGTDYIEFDDDQIAGIKEDINSGTTVKWVYKYTPVYTQVDVANVEIFNLGNYTGENDTYYFDVTSGLRPATSLTGPTASITTAYGKENQTTVLTSSAWATSGTSGTTPGAGIAFGTQGLKLRFKNAGAANGLPGYFKLIIPIEAPVVYRYPGLRLADNVIDKLRPESSLTNKYINLRLLAKEDIELSAISPYDGSDNWEQETTHILLHENATTVLPEFVTTAGAYIPLYVYGFGNYEETEYSAYSKMYFNYREWSPVHATSCTFCETVSALDNIIGPLDVDNPLKWAVYKALTNSNGASVAYVAVKDPEDLDDWQDALSVVEGRTDVYTIVPLTTDLTVQNLVLTLVNAESAAEACRWKTALFNMELPTEVMRIGASTNTQTPTSTNQQVVRCKIVQNPLLTKPTYNKLICTSGNSKFIDYGVVPGDEVRIKGSDNETIMTYTVDQVYSNGTLIIVEDRGSAGTEDITEIWHTYTKNEEVELIRDRAQSFASRRVGLVWPDIVAEGAIEMSGYYLSAALAGLKSGVEPEQGLTRRTIQGFDSFARSKPRYTESQLDLMASSGVWICVEDSDGTPQSRHALNTDMTNTFYSEEMMTRNFDSVSKYMYQVIDAYIGTSNVTEETLLAIYYNIRKACDYLIGQGQMINYTNITVKQHDLLLDRVVAYLNVGLPFAVNNVELYITAEAYELNAVTLESEAE